MAVLRVSARDLSKAGLFFVAAARDASQLDLALGPAALRRDGGSPFIRSDEIPHQYEPAFLNVLMASILGSQVGPALEAIGQKGPCTLYRVPPAVTTVLSQLTPEQPDFTVSFIEAAAVRALSHREVPGHYKPGGIKAAILILRTHALSAVARGADKEVYYWFRKP